MTRNMVARLGIVGAVLIALTFFALQASGSSSEPTSLETAGNADTRAANDDTTGVPAVAAPQASETSGETAAIAQTTDTSVTMTLLHNNDGESKLLPNPDGGFPGIARFAQAWVDLGRTTDADILLRVSSGDNFLASKEFAAGLAREGLPLYDSIALRGLYEVMGLGNHDFDFGPDVTARFIDGFRLNETADPVIFVATNIDVSAEPALQALVDEGRIAPSAIFTDPTSGLDVGVIGALTPRLANISSPRNVTVDADVAAAVNAEAASLIAQGVDRIVLVSHLQGLAEDQALVPLLSGVDIVVAGGGDELLKNDGDTCQADEEAFAPYPLMLVDADGNDVPVVTAPGGYRCIGRLDITFDAEGQITGLEGASIAVDVDGKPEEFALARVEEPLAEALAELDATVVGQSEVDLDGRRNSVRSGPSNEGELLADALLAAGQSAPNFGGAAPTVAVQNGGGIRNDALLPAGEITASDTFDIAPFANFVVTGDVSRERFKEMLEVAVAGLPSPEGTFPQIAGFTMDIDVSQPARIVDNEGDCSLVDDAGSRVRYVVLDDGTEIVRDGQVVAGDDLSLATIDFLANGGDCYPLGDLDFTTVGVSYQQALSNFIIENLNGTISSADYPVGGSRIVIANADAAAPDDTTADDAALDDGDADDAALDDGDGDDGDADDAALDDGDSGETSGSEDLANTGMGSWLIVIIALTIAGGGALIFAEAQRAGRLSLTNRLSATRAWFPSNDDESQ